MTDFVKFLFAVALLFAAVSVIMVLAIAWTHYPRGVLCAYRDRKRREREKRGYDR